MADEAAGENSTSAIEAERQLRHINDEWVAALERGDTATLNRLMDEGCVFSYALDGDDRDQFIAE
ncbi:MAG TPA: hypothetical protein VJZ91_02925, partial [Blastocatellia bacterium]|nr:hypothetical protein [Blastocatellia bacterium]